MLLFKIKQTVPLRAGLFVNSIFMKIQKLLLILPLLLFCCAANAQLPNISDPRVHIKLPTVKGDSLSLVSFKGKVILLDFWASWCGPCRSSNRQLVKLYAKYKVKGFEIFGVSMDEEKEGWKKAIKKDKITWLQVNDPRGRGNKTALDWNIFQLPTSYLINKKGDVVIVNPGDLELEQNVKKLLEE
jgi:thiol-disulfide isomerase/thioredoxin